MNSIPPAITRERLAGSRTAARRRSWREAAVVSWAGARGVVPLASALSIPLTTAAGRPVPGRDLVLVLAAGVIVFSLVGQGLTLEPLVRRAGIAAPAAAAWHEATLVRLRISEAGLAWLEQLAADAAVPDEMINRLRRNLRARTRALEDDARARRRAGPLVGDHRRPGLGAAGAVQAARWLELIPARRPGPCRRDPGPVQPGERADPGGPGCSARR